MEQGTDITGPWCAAGERLRRDYDEIIERWRQRRIMLLEGSLRGSSHARQQMLERAAGRLASYTNTVSSVKPAEAAISSVVFEVLSIIRGFPQATVIRD